MTPAVITVTPETTFKETAERLLDYGVSGMPVVDSHGRLVGLVTEADLMSKEAFDNRHRRPLEIPWIPLPATPATPGKRRR
jgi:CBS domain-containing protein